MCACHFHCIFNPFLHVFYRKYSEIQWTNWLALQSSPSLRGNSLIFEYSSLTLLMSVALLFTLALYIKTKIFTFCWSSSWILQLKFGKFLELFTHLKAASCGKMHPIMQVLKAIIKLIFFLSATCIRQLSFIILYYITL